MAKSDQAEMLERCSQESSRCYYSPVIEEIRQKTSDVHKIFYGVAGDYKRGILFELDRNTVHRKFMEKWGFVILTAFTGVPFTVLGLIIYHYMAGK